MIARTTGEDKILHWRTSKMPVLDIVVFWAEYCVQFKRYRPRHWLLNSQLYETLIGEVLALPENAPNVRAYGISYKVPDHLAIAMHLPHIFDIPVLPFHEKINAGGPSRETETPPHYFYWHHALRGEYHGI